jgi:hypothetical protein
MVLFSRLILSFRFRRGGVCSWDAESPADPDLLFPLRGLGQQKRQLDDIGGNWGAEVITVDNRRGNVVTEDAT